jgi:hypothetical protein
VEEEDEKWEESERTSPILITMDSVDGYFINISFFKNVVERCFKIYS